MEASKTFAPYKLTVIVHSAENLPIADVTTSDPYVVVSLGDKTVGKTKTVYKNHLLPEWEELFNVKLLHTKQSILFSIFDEDKGKNDDLLGTVTVELSKVALGSSSQRTFDVVNAGTYKVKAKLHLTLILGRNDKVIQIVPDTSAEEELSALATDKYTQDDMKTIENELSLIETSECVQKSLYRFVTNGRTSYLTKGLLKDLLCDIHSMTARHDKTEGIFHSLQFNNNVEFLFKRNKLRLTNSSEIGLYSKHCVRHSPIHRNSIQLNLLADNTSYLLLQLPNRYSMWSWVRWLRLSYDVWTREMDLNSPDMPKWAQNGSYTSTVPVTIIRSDGRVSTGKCTVSFRFPFELRINDEIIRCKPLLSMIVSQDSSLPKAYVMEVDITSFQIVGTGTNESLSLQQHIDAQNDLLAAHNDAHQISAVADDKVSPDKHEKMRKRDYVYGFGKGVAGAMKGAVKGAVGVTSAVVVGAANVTSAVAVGAATVTSNVALGAKDVAVDTVFGVTGAVVNTGKALVSLNPVNVKAAMTDAVIGAGKGFEDIATNIVYAPNNMFGKVNSYIIMKAPLAVQKFTKETIFQDHFYLDLNEENLEAKSSQLIENNLENVRNNNSKYNLADKQNSNARSTTHFPVVDSSNTGLDILLYQGVEGHETLVASKHIPVRTLLKSKGKNSMSSSLALGEVGTSCAVPNEVEFTLDGSTGMRITLLHGKGLVIPPPSIGTNIPGNGVFGSMYAKCKIVNGNGHSGDKSGADKKTQNIAACPNPDWKEKSFMVSSADSGFSTGEYVRIELFVEYLTSNASIGAIFIPFEYFLNKSTEYSFPIVKYRQTSTLATSSTALVPSAAGDVGLGEISVRIKRIDEEGSSKCKLTLRSSLKESNIFNSLWYGECLLAGNLEADNVDKYLETHTVSASFDGLLLVDNKNVCSLANHVSTVDLDKANANNTRRTSLSQDNSGALGAKKKSSVGEEGAVVMPSMVIEVFQNQRRQFMYPFDWSNHALTRPDYSDLTYQIAYKFDDISNAVPPEGFVWDPEPWTIDKKYTATDENGWSYAVTFGKLLSNYKAGKSYTRPGNTHARRRKWVRTARMVPTTSAAISGDFQMNDDYFTRQSELSNRPTEAWMRPSFDPHSFAKGNDKNYVPPAGSSNRLSISSTGSPQTPLSENSKSMKANRDLSPWRKDLFHAAVSGNGTFLNNVMALCQERTAEGAPVIIQWSAIYSATIVTPSVLSVHFCVNRYFGEEVLNKSISLPKFQPVEMELFVSNCNAFELKGLIDERIWFSRYRNDIKHLILNDTPPDFGPFHNERGYSLGSPGTPTTPGGTHGNAFERRDSALSIGSGIDVVPETEELTIGSEIIADLDDTSIALERKLTSLDALYLKTRDANILLEKAVIIRRDCRLRLYMAALLGVGLHSSHSFEPDDVSRLMESDFRRMASIHQDNDVSTANNRIEYLLDTAEKRIRDTALCGWKYKGGKLEECLEVLTNGYFIEIVGLLGTFFDDQGQMGVKGLHSKVELITTYMKHNDRLDLIIESSLRPFALMASPPPKMSLFLDFNILSSWYTSVLLFEMRGRVDDVLSVWKDVTKDVSGQTALYKYPLPWVPQRYHKDSGIFYSAIPEDLVEILMTYLSYARLRKENVASSFHASIGKLDSTVCLSFTSAFLYLSEAYQNAMGGKDYSAVGEDELVEYSTFVTSIANDARRVREVNILSAVENKELDSCATPVAGSTNFEVDYDTQRKVVDLVDSTYHAYDKVMLKALDHLSCILFMYLFHASPSLLDRDFHKMWKAAVLAAANDAASGTSSKSIGFASQSELESNKPSAPGLELIPKLLSDFSEYLEDQIDFLEPHCYYKLVEICADKFVVYYLTFLREAKAAGQVYPAKSAYMTQIGADIEAIKQCFSVAIGRGVTKDKYSTVMERFAILDHSYNLLSHDLNSEELVDTLGALIQVALDHHRRDFSIATLIETCMGLRGIKEYMVRPTLTNKVSAIIPPSPMSIVGSSAASQQASQKPGGSTQSTPPPAKRGSIFGFLAAHTTAPAPAAPAHPVPTSSFDNDTDAPDDKDAEEEDEEDEMYKVMMEEKNAAFARWIGEKVNEIHALHRNTAVSTANSTESLVNIPPECRVFDSKSDCAKYSLKAQLLQSAFPAAKRELLTAPTTSNSFSSNILTSAFSNMFSTKTSSARSSFAAGTPAAPVHYHHNRRSSNMFVSHQLSDGAHEKTVAFQMLITRLEIHNLFYLEIFNVTATLRPYLIIRLGDYSYKTEVKDGETNPNWLSECPIELPVYDQNFADNDSSKSSMHELTISLYYQGYFNDQFVAAVSMPFTAFAPLQFDDKQVVISDFSKTPRAAQAAAKAMAEGRGCPTLTLSITEGVAPNK